MSCCPKSAWGELKNPDYKEKGTVEKVRLIIKVTESLDNEIHEFKIRKIAKASFCFER